MRLGRRFFRALLFLRFRWFRFALITTERAVWLEVHLFAGLTATAGRFAGIIAGAVSLLRLLPGGLADVTRSTLAGDQREVDFTFVHVDRFHADFHAIAQTISLAAGFTDQTLPDLIETIVVVIQRGDVHQTIDKQFIESHEETKAGHAGNHTFKDVTHLIQHKVTLQPVGDFAGSFVGTTFGHRTVCPQLQHFIHAVVPAAGFGTVAFMALLFRQQVLNRTVQRQVRVTTNRRSEVRVRLQRQTKVAAVFRVVYRLLHRTQQHRLQHFMIRTIGNRDQQLSVITRLWFIAARQLQPQLRQYGTECGNRFGARLIVDTEQRRLQRLLNEACGGDVRQNHALFDQFVRIVTLRLLNALNTTFSVKDKLRFFALKGDPAAFFTGAIQHFIKRMQLFNMLHQRRIVLTQLLVTLQHMPHFGVGQTRV